MAQVSAWDSEFEPERVRTYAIQNPKLEDDVYTANGAALQSKSNWYRLRFKCTLEPDHGKVVAFEFAIGDMIPREVWTRYDLYDEREEH